MTEILYLMKGQRYWIQIKFGENRKSSMCSKFSVLIFWTQSFQIQLTIEIKLVRWNSTDSFKSEQPFHVKIWNLLTKIDVGKSLNFQGISNWYFILSIFGYAASHQCKNIFITQYYEDFFMPDAIGEKWIIKSKVEAANF